MIWVGREGMGPRGFQQNLRTSLKRLSQHHLTPCSCAGDAPEVPGCSLTAAGVWSMATRSMATRSCCAESC